MRQLPPGSSGASKAAHAARRLWPMVLLAWERWQALSPDQKEHYKRQAREYSERGRKALADRSRRR